MNALLAPRPRKHISLTALIDVVFILLLFFMLTTSFSDWRELLLSNSAATQKPSQQQPQIVLITAAGDFLAQNRQPIALPKLPDIFSDHNPIVVVPAGSATLQTAVNGIQQLRTAGFSQVTLGKPFDDGNHTASDLSKESAQ